MDPQPYPINGVLDLHQFKPSEAGEVVDAWLDACLEEKIYRVKIIHGKGIGTLRTRVHNKLEKDPRVVSFALADLGNGGWGATTAVLKP